MQAENGKYECDLFKKQKLIKQLIDRHEEEIFKGSEPELTYGIGNMTAFHRLRPEQ